MKTKRTLTKKPVPVTLSDFLQNYVKDTRCTLCNGRGALSRIMTLASDGRDGSENVPCGCAIRQLLRSYPNLLVLEDHLENKRFFWPPDGKDAAKPPSSPALVPVPAESTPVQTLAVQRRDEQLARLKKQETKLEQEISKLLPKNPSSPRVQDLLAKFYKTKRRIQRVTNNE